MTGPYLQVFISSKMQRNVLQAEREAARSAVEGLGIAKPWHWETCGCAAPYPPMMICLEAVRNSDALVLILGSDLTGPTRAEHELAVSLGIPDFMFLRQGRVKSATRDYVQSHQARCSYMKFKTPQELQTMIESSLRRYLVDGFRNRKANPPIGTQVPIVGKIPASGI